MISELLLYAPEADFVEPYIRRALPGVTISTPETANTPQLAVMISSVDIYDPQATPEDASENTPLAPASHWADREKEFAATTRRHGLKPLILRCADIVATGMTGFPRHLAEAIWKGTFFHFPANEARRSVIHAADIADLVQSVAASGLPAADSLIYNITDGTNPTIHDLAEALAFRMKNKRISTLSTGPQQWMGRIIYGRRRYSLYTTTRTYSSAAAALDMAFRPTPVCEYLRTHTYAENSL